VLSAGRPADLHDDPGHEAWQAWTGTHRPGVEACNRSLASVHATPAATPMLEAAGHALSRASIPRQRMRLKDVAAPMLLTGPTMSMSMPMPMPVGHPNVFRRIRIMRFDGKPCLPQGAPVGD
jgi:hypothetical protein